MDSLKASFESPGNLQVRIKLYPKETSSFPVQKLSYFMASLCSERASIGIRMVGAHLAHLAFTSLPSCFSIHPGSCLCCLLMLPLQSTPQKPSLNTTPQSFLLHSFVQVFVFPLLPCLVKPPEGGSSSILLSKASHTKPKISRLRSSIKQVNWHVTLEDLCPQRNPVEKLHLPSGKRESFCSLVTKKVEPSASSLDDFKTLNV